MWQSLSRRWLHSSRFGYPTPRIFVRFAVPTMSWLGIGSAEMYVWAKTGWLSVAAVRTIHANAWTMLGFVANFWRLLIVISLQLRTHSATKCPAGTGWRLPGEFRGSTRPTCARRFGKAYHAFDSMARVQSSK